MMMMMMMIIIIIIIIIIITFSRGYRNGKLAKNGLKTLIQEL